MGKTADDAGAATGQPGKPPAKREQRKEDSQQTTMTTPPRPDQTNANSMSDDKKTGKRLTLESVAAMNDNELTVSPFGTPSSSEDGDESNSDDWETIDESSEEDEH